MKPSTASTSPFTVRHTGLGSLVRSTGPGKTVKAISPSGRGATLIGPIAYSLPAASSTRKESAPGTGNNSPSVSAHRPEPALLGDQHGLTVGDHPGGGTDDAGGVDGAPVGQSEQTSVEP